MYIIGLCGTSGSGKGLVSQYFNSQGIPAIDADAVYRELLYPNSPLIKELSAEFGADIITKDGELDRIKLSGIVFSQNGRKTALPRLNAIAHRAIIAEVERKISDLEERGCAAVIFDAPQLFESGFDKQCDYIIGVGASESVRLMRIMRRDGISEADALGRIRSQLCDSFFEKNCDVFVHNNGTEAEFFEKIKSIYMNIKGEIK